MEKRMIKLKGNELGWILKLAQEHLLCESFQRTAPTKLQRFLYELMGQFHEINFYVGTSKDIWILTNEPKQKKKIRRMFNESVIDPLLDGEDIAIDETLLWRQIRVRKDTLWEDAVRTFIGLYRNKINKAVKERTEEVIEE